MGFLTTGELAFAVPAGVVLGAAISGAVGSFTGHLNRKASAKARELERQFAHEGRLWTKRAEVYADAIHRVNNLRAFLEQNPKIDEYPVDKGSIYGPLTSQLLAIHPTLQLLAGADVARLLEPVMRDTLALYELAPQIERDWDRLGPIAEMTPAGQAALRELQSTYASLQPSLLQSTTGLMKYFVKEIQELPAEA